MNTRFHTDKRSKNGSPFIWLNMPFVRKESTGVLPFVNLKIPFVEKRENQRGFTLFELLITLSIAAVLAGIAVPSYQTFIENNRLTTITNDLIADTSFARTEAMKRQRGTSGSGQMAICVSSNGTGCTSGGWHSGWIVFWDNDGNNSYSASTDTILKMHEAAPPSVTSTVNPSGTALFVFDTIGRITSGITSVQMTNTKTNKSRLVCFATSGRTMVRENTGSCS